VRNEIMNKTVIITGASRGIGRATALLFAKSGYNVVINYNNSDEKAALLCREIISYGGSAVAIKADVSDTEQVNSMVSSAIKIFGGVDVLINNAGIAKYGLFSDIPPSEWDELFAVNVKGVYNCCRAVLPDMISRKSGKIINVSSVWGIIGASCEVAYSASKAAVIGLTKALAKELGPSNIQVNCVAPGVIETDMIAGLSDNDRAELADETPLMRLGRPEEVAEAIMFLASEKADFFTGQVLSPNGGFVI
jgi:3-oxoacyl-[acyl-carrier protein] reductase